jgi:ribosomal protein L34E
MPDRTAAEPIDLDERKERVLHTRVPDSLDRHLKRRARSLGMSVSTVVRNVLLTTFGLVEDIVNDSTDIALALTGDERATARGARRRLDRAAGSRVVAWHEAVLNLNAVCAHCNAILKKGSRAAVGLAERPGAPAVICRACLRRLEHGQKPDGGAAR